MEERKDNYQHELKLSKRKNLEVSGVKEVLSFDEMSVVLMTVCGELSLEGKDIKISTLDTDKGMVVLEGQIDSMIYADDTHTEKKGFFGRMFS